MPPEGIPIAARTLLTERFASIAQLETLLLLHALAAPFAATADPARERRPAPASEAAGARDAGASAGAPRIAAPGAAQILEELAAARLAVAHDLPGHRVYRFPVEDAALLSAVEELRAVYAEK